MKNPDRDSVSRLDALPNIGKKMASTLISIGIHHPKQLIGMEPFKMYEELCIKTGQRPDPCVMDVFMSVVHFMEGGGSASVVVVYSGTKKDHTTIFEALFLNF